MSFSGIYSVRSGLNAAQRALDVIGQNVSNASTAGYSRQEVSNISAEPGHVINSAGRGIRDVNVLRYRDEFLDRNFRARSGAQGYFDTKSAQLQQVEQIVGDLSDKGLRNSLDEFFNSWSNLATHPKESFARQQVISTAVTFIDTAQAAFNGLVDQRAAIDQMIQTKVADINNAANQLVELNKAIIGVGKGQQMPNDLLDRRDQLIDSLAKLAGATAVRQDDGSVTVHIGSFPLVDRQSVYPITATTATEADMDPSAGITSTQQAVTTLTWNGTGTPLLAVNQPVGGNNTPALMPMGELSALLELRDQVIPQHMQSLDNLVRTVANEVNVQSTTAYPPDPAGPQIFDVQGTWMNIRVDPTLKPDMLMPGKTAGSGDGDRARAIAALRDQPILTGGPVGGQMVKPGDFIQAIQTQIGIQVQDATQRSEAASMQTSQAEKLRQSVMGVSIDDEMTKMIQFQQAYNAAARIMATMNEMLETLVAIGR